MSRNRVPKNETKLDKFERIVAHRASKALAAMAQLNQMGNNPKAYEYTGKHIDQLQSALQSALNSAMDTFRRGLTGKSPVKQMEFKFD